MKVRICATHPRYEVDLSENEAYWERNSYVNVYTVVGTDQREPVLKARFDNQYLNLPTSYYVSMQRPVEHKTNWYYLMGSLPANWYDASVTGFTEGQYGQYPASTNHIQVYKKTFSVASLANGGASRWHRLPLRLRGVHERPRGVPQPPARGSHHGLHHRRGRLRVADVPLRLAAVPHHRRRGRPIRGVPEGGQQHHRHRADRPEPRRQLRQHLRRRAAHDGRRLDQPRDGRPSSSTAASARASPTRPSTATTPTASTS